MDNIYSKVFNMGTEEMLGRVNATVAFLDYHIDGSCCITDDKIMRNILEGAENDDVYGRICALIGYITGDTCPTEHEKLVFEMVTGEKLEAENKPDDAGTSTDSAE